MPFAFLMGHLAALGERIKNWYPMRTVWGATTKTTFRVILCLASIMLGYILIGAFLSGSDYLNPVIVTYWLLSSPLFYIYSKKLTQTLNSKN